jgi:hypothetical protein
VASEARAGDLALFAPIDAVGRFIAWMTRGPSHVALAIGPGVWLDVAPPACRAVTEDFYARRRWAVFRPPVAEWDRPRVRAMALSFVGREYDELRLVLVGASIRPWRSRRGVVCSTAVATILSIAANVVWRDDAGALLDAAHFATPATINRQRQREGWPLVYESEPSAIP